MLHNEDVIKRELAFKHKERESAAFFKFMD